jgi:DNA-binding transcriptional LysR family regulator
MQRSKRASELPSTLDSLRWDDVRLFLALAREGALGPAARRLDVDASTASRRLAALEEALGARLFDRSPERMEASAHAFARDATGFEREVEGRVRISAPPGVADVFVAASLPQLLRRHPRIVLEIDARMAVVDLARREADLALRTVRPKGQDLVQKLLSRVRSTALGSPDYVRSLGTLRSLRDARYVMFGEFLAHTPHMAWLKKHLPEPPVALVTDSYVCQLRAAEAGAGLVFATPQIAGVSQLVEPKVSAPVKAALAELPESELWLVGHAATREVPRIAAVWSFFEDLFAGITTAEGVRARMRPTS